MKPSLRKDPNDITLQVGINDLILDRTLRDIATSIVNLSLHCNLDSQSIVISVYQTSS